MTENKFDRIRVVDVGPITKALLMTDAHYGARNNSDQHNQDNGRYIDWFIDHCKKEKASHVFFLGDWFENRNQVSVKTLNYSLQDARKLNALGIPIIFIIGNHDLYLRNSRDIFSTNMFADLENFVIVSEPMYLDNDKKYLVSPYLFKDEYPQLAAAINAATYVFGHFEFRDFVVTGADRRNMAPMLMRSPALSTFSLVTSINDRQTRISFTSETFSQRTTVMPEMQNVGWRSSTRTMMSASSIGKMRPSSSRCVSRRF